MGTVTRLDEVSIFGDKLSFFIPHEWVETSDKDHYLYHLPETESGWLRVTLLTVRAVDEAPRERLKQLFEGKENVSTEERTGNIVCTSEKDSEEKGKRIHLYYWNVANVIAPDLVREAVFSYTVLRERIYEDQTRQTVEIIGKLVSQAEFHQSP